MKKKKGYTLIELIMAFTILSIAMVGIGQAIVFGVKMHVKNTKKVDTSVYAQAVVQNYRSLSKSYIMTEFGITSITNKYMRYCYFDDMTELNTLLQSASSLTSGNYNDMITGTTDKNYGAYIEFSNNSSKLGTVPGGSTEINLGTGFKYLRIYVKVVNKKELGKNDSDLIFYMGR